MPGFDLSSLNSEELRRVLEAARSRNQPELTQEVLTELSSRRSRPPGRAPWRDRVEPEAQSDVWWEDLRQEAEVAEPAEGGRTPVILGVVVAVLLSAGVGWWLSPRGQGHAAPPQVAAVDTAPRAMAALAPTTPTAPPTEAGRPVETAAPPVSAPPPAPATPIAAAPPPPVIAAAPPRPMKAEPAKVAKAEPAKAEPVKVARAEPVKVARAEATLPTPAKPRAAATEPAPTKAAACEAQPTPADRTICTYPALAAQDRRMHEAYDRAIDAGADPALLDREQAQFHIRRDGVWNRDTLAKLYDRRIRELDATAARAARATPPI